jgi:hypothetical protein
MDSRWPWPDFFSPRADQAFMGLPAAVVLAWGGTWSGKEEARGIQRTAAMRDDALYNASLGIDAASGNGTEATPPEATRGQSI